MRAVALAAAAWLCLAGAASAQAPAVDHDRLPALLEADGFVPPDGFKALVVRIDRADDGTLGQAAFDWRGTSADREGWWPASTVKIYAVVAALERLHRLGFALPTWLTFHYEEGDVSQRMDQIVRHAIEHSSNAAFDRLVELVGFDEINTEFFVPRNGFDQTVFLRAYNGRIRDETTGNGLNRHSPRITLRRGQREMEVPARDGHGDYDCPDQGNCTTLRELAEVMRRIMLHEELGEGVRYELAAADLHTIRDAMAIAQNHEIADRLAEAFGETPVRVYHKPGFALQWVSDVAFVHRTDTNERWVVAMAAQPDRRALDDAATRIGALLARGAFRER